jgi:nicotinate-nucleotide adenylyltransferase
VAPEALRLRMLEAALAGQPGFVADDRELRRPGPSFMVDTLASLRAEHATRPLCLMLGLDAFNGVASWHRADELLSLAHLLVAHRPGSEPESAGPVARMLAVHRAPQPRDLSTRPAGLIWLQTVTALDIASSAIRESLAAGGDVRYLVPEPVRELIEKTHVYAHPKEVRTRAQ